MLLKKKNPKLLHFLDMPLNPPSLKICQMYYSQLKEGNMKNSFNGLWFVGQAPDPILGNFPKYETP